MRPPVRHPLLRRRSGLPVLATAAVLAALTTPLGAAPAVGAAAPVGAGFTVTASDLSFILKQIQVAERHAATRTASDPCGTLVARAGDGIPDRQQVPDRLTSYGLRTVDGSCNNLFPPTTRDRLSPLTASASGSATVVRGRLGAADEPFPRLVPARFRTAEGRPAGFYGPHDRGSASSSYAQKTGTVFDSSPRLVSNLVSDQTSTNPAALAAAAFPVRSQGNPGRFPCSVDPDPTATPPVPGSPADCVPSGTTLDIPNVTTDVGLSPPYNSLFTYFGQFFDHGVDQTVKGGGTVFVPLRADDPLRTHGPDHVAGTGDEVRASQAFMVLTRAQNLPGPDGVLGDDPATPADESADDVQDGTNTDSPWVDLSQTYSSHPSHQVFLREYSPDGPDGVAGTADDRPVSTGRLLGGLAAGETYPDSPDGRTGMATWAAVKRQAAEELGLLLTDRDALDVPMLATDPYGQFLPGPHGLPQYVLRDGTLLEGDLEHPVPVPNDVRRFATPFLTDIAHNADPTPQDTDHNPGTPPVAPTPDTDDAPSTWSDVQRPGTYDDELLDAHFTAGDGRVNENIALTAIHQAFATEHDRLVADIAATLEKPANAALLAAFRDVRPDSTDPLVRTSTFGDRLFQAARFVNEMEYQHLVFEEFGRKMVPGIRPFTVYSPDIDPSVRAEFAHAVYRFGHSMLDDEVARVNVDPATHATTDNSLPLLAAFLSPPEYFDNVGDEPYTPAQAAGAVVMGSSDQVGNEIDEFVVETLRNNLLGLPLDLATLNLARARETGVPTLNELRRALSDRTNDGRLTPYGSWSEFGQALKHPESLVNFVAAYGTHPTVTGARTAAAKRDAARALVDPRPAGTTTAGDVPPEDAADFMYGTGAWADTPGGVPTTGLEDVDLWIGGLAEHTAIGGGLLGSTFEYVFQTQLEDLQDGDRFYYLHRTPGMNLRAQLEGNSFAELLQRTTDGTDSLAADAFSTADCTFQLANLRWPYDGSPTSSGLPAVTGAGSVTDDPTTPDCDENQLLLRRPDGTIAYRTRNAVDPSGINGQGVWNGTAGRDRVVGGVDNDTFWGGDGRDVLEGGFGDDVALGGDGDDVLTDAAGIDVLKGGPGDDAADAGAGDDILMGGDGQDVLNGGAGDNQTFAGPGDDFVLAGQGSDGVFGDDGDDWIEGGAGQDLLQGDHGAPFFDDPGQSTPGNDIMIGQVGENDYDAEGGDDVMAQNAAIDRNAGAGGWDWATHQYDTVGADDDMAVNNNLGPTPVQVVVNSDRWAETEGNSGSAFDDVIRGNDDVPAALSGGGFAGCGALDQAGLDRVRGLDALVPPLSGTGITAADLAADAAAGSCPLEGPVWGQGNILLGGGGSDVLEGRGGDDIIDGDQALTVRISVRTDPADPRTETGSTDALGAPARTGTFGPGTAGMTLQKAVFAGLVDPGSLVAVREIAPGDTAPADCAAGAPRNCDTAVFSGPESEYEVSRDGAALLVTHVTGADGADGEGADGAGADGVGADGEGETEGVEDETEVGVEDGAQAGDGTDRLTGVERLQFADGTVAVTAPAAPSGVTATSSRAAVDAATGSVTVSWSAPADGGLTGFEVVVSSGGSVVSTVSGIGPEETSRTVTGLTVGTPYTFQVRAANRFGSGPLSAVSAPVAPRGPVAAPTAVTATRGDLAATVSWTAPASERPDVTGYLVQVRNGTSVVTTLQTSGGATSTTVRGLVQGRAYTFRVATVTPAGVSPFSAASNAVTAATLAGPPVIGSAAPGARGGTLTARASWAPPTETGGLAVWGYRVTALRMAANGTTVLARTTRTIGAAARTRELTLPAGSYRFEVVAFNALGDGAPSARSNLVAAR